jgi:hypothetical protein
MEMEIEKLMLEMEEMETGKNKNNSSPENFKLYYSSPNGFWPMYTEEWRPYGTATRLRNEFFDMGLRIPIKFIEFLLLTGKPFQIADGRLAKAVFGEEGE